MIWIKERDTGRILFEGNFSTMQDAIQEAVRRKVSLRRANLAYENIERAHIDGADLREADFTHTRARYIFARRANFSGALFDNTDIRNSELEEADLTETVWSGEFTQCHGVNFDNAIFKDVSWWNEIISHEPLIIHGMYFIIMITAQQMAIDCEHHTHEEWQHFDRKGKVDAAKYAKHWIWWMEHKPVLLQLCEVYKKDVEKSEGIKA